MSCQTVPFTCRLAHYRNQTKNLTFLVTRLNLAFSIIVYKISLPCVHFNDEVICTPRH